MAAQMNDPNPVSSLQEVVRPLLIDCSVPETPVGIWGTCFLARYRRHLFVVTAAHLVKGNHSGEIRLLPSDRSKNRLPISQGIGAFTDEKYDKIDLIVFPATFLGLKQKEIRQSRFLNLDSREISQWKKGSQTSQFCVIGYPRELSEIDYDLAMISAVKVSLGAQYFSLAEGSSITHRLSVENRYDLDEFAGFSGSPVFSQEIQLGAKPKIRFCGVAVTGSSSSQIMHFIDAETVLQLMDSAISHIKNFGMQLVRKKRKLT